MILYVYVCAYISLCVCLYICVYICMCMCLPVYVYLVMFTSLLSLCLCVCVMYVSHFLSLCLVTMTLLSQILLQVTSVFTNTYFMFINM